MYVKKHSFTNAVATLRERSYMKQPKYALKLTLYKRCVPVGIISVIIHENNITQTDDHQSVCELFRSCWYDPNLKKGSQEDLIKVHLYFHSRELLKQSTKH